MHLGTGVLDIDPTDGRGVSETQHITFLANVYVRQM